VCVFVCEYGCVGVGVGVGVINNLGETALHCPAAHSKHGCVCVSVCMCVCAGLCGFVCGWVCVWLWVGVGAIDDFSMTALPTMRRATSTGVYVCV